MTDMDYWKKRMSDLLDGIVFTAMVGGLGYLLYLAFIY